MIQIKKITSIILSLLLVLSLSITSFASDLTTLEAPAYTMQASVNTVPTTDHIPENYTYWFSYAYMGTYHVYYLKKLPNVFLVDYATMITIYPSSAIWEFASDEKGYNYHLYTDSWHSDATHTVTAKSTSQLKLYKNCLLMSNFSIKTKSGDYYWQFLRTDESLTKNYEVVTEGTYDGTNGDATITDTDDNNSDAGLLGSILDAIISIPTKIIDFLKSILENIVNLITTIRDFCVNFFDNLIDFFKRIFIPDPNFLSEKIEELKSYFAFVDVIRRSVSEIFAMLERARQGIAIPEITIDFSTLKSGSLKNSGKFNVFNFDWYAAYKPKVDTILSAFIWLFTFWRLFKRLASVVSGNGGAEK